MSTDDLLAFLRDSPTPFHAVSEAKARLKGFRALSMKDSWSALEPGGYMVDMGESSLVAFVLPERSKSARGVRSKFRLVGAHTDSPNLRLKPNAEYTKEGYTQLGVEVYGGALLNSWLDRDLGPQQLERQPPRRGEAARLRRTAPAQRPPPHRAQHRRRRAAYRLVSRPQRSVDPRACARSGSRSRPRTGALDSCACLSRA